MSNKRFLTNFVRTVYLMKKDEFSKFENSPLTENLVPRTRLELVRFSTQASKTCVATNYTTSAFEDTF